MPAAKARRQRRRGTIELLPSKKYRVNVYVGVDPVSKRRVDLTEVIATQAEAEKALTRLLHQVDERLNPRTSATVSQLLDRWLNVIDVEPSTR